MTDALSAKLAALLALHEKAQAADAEYPGQYTLARHNYNVAARNALPILIRAVQVALEAECDVCREAGLCEAERETCEACAWKREMLRVLEGL